MAAKPEKPKSARTLRYEADRKAKTRELDFKRITFTPAEVAKVRGVCAASAKAEHDRTECQDAVELMTHLGMMPDQKGWYYEEHDPLTPRPEGPSNG